MKEALLMADALSGRGLRPTVYRNVAPVLLPGNAPRPAQAIYDPLADPDVQEYLDLEDGCNRRVKGRGLHGVARALLLCCSRNVLRRLGQPCCLAQLLAGGRNRGYCVRPSLTAWCVQAGSAGGAGGGVDP